MELKRIEVEIEETEKRLMTETKTNTDLLESLRRQRLREFEMEKAEQKQQSTTDLMERNADDDGKTKRLLLKEVREQAKIICDLRNCILRFKRKDTQIHQDIS